MEKPKFEHDCNHCKFLGCFQESDLYICVGKDSITLISRESNNGSDYRSALISNGKYYGSNHDSLVEALNRAKKKGYVNDDTR
jgi:hypothetical protein